MPEFDTVLLDVGGVLVSDPWESILLTPQRGLVDRLGLDRRAVEQIGKEVWEKYCLRPTNEDDYWTEVFGALEVDLAPETVGQLEEELIVANTRGDAILAAIREAGITIGVVSEASSFWYPKQFALAHLEGYVDHSREFVSYRLGVGKRASGRGLYEIASERVEPDRTLVVDDRSPNLERAASVGFEGFEYSLASEPSVLQELMKRATA